MTDCFMVQLDDEEMMRSLQGTHDFDIISALTIVPFPFHIFLFFKTSLEQQIICCLLTFSMQDTV